MTYFDDCEELDKQTNNAMAYKQQRERLRAINAELLAALEHLVDEQNGPPLEHPRKKLQWEVAYAAAIAAIKRAREAK